MTVASSIASVLASRASKFNSAQPAIMMAASNPAIGPNSIVPSAAVSNTATASADQQRNAVRPYFSQNG